MSLRSTRDQNPIFIGEDAVLRANSFKFMIWRHLSTVQHCHKICLSSEIMEEGHRWPDRFACNQNQTKCTPYHWSVTTTSDFNFECMHSPQIPEVLDIPQLQNQALYKISVWRVSLIGIQILNSSGDTQISSASRLRRHVHSVMTSGQ